MQNKVSLTTASWLQNHENLDLDVTTIAGGYRVQAGNIALEILTGPMRIRFLRDEKLLLESVTDRTIEGHLRFSPFAKRADSWLVALALGNGEPVYGLGEKWAALNRRGQLIHNWNEDATTLNSELSYKNTPFAWSPEGWGLFVHTPSKVTHGVGYPQWSHRSYILQVFDAELDLFFMAADTPAQMIERYTHLTGRATLPPRWSYGMWISRAYYQTAEIALEVAHKLRENKIPCDVLLLDGRAWHTMEDRFDFQWDPARYPDPYRLRPGIAFSGDSPEPLGIFLPLHTQPFVQRTGREGLFSQKPGRHTLHPSLVPLAV